MADRNNTPPCVVCRLIRTYFLIAVPMILMIYIKPELTWVKGIALTDLFATVIGVLFVITVVWKAYQEFWKPKRDQAKKRQP
ncbi:disulfide bond formation protein B [SAR92 clade bacterium H921]|jgi:disulfide bond formation protein DsbB|nr:disulfide bond formation protein B [SAR92 clade bacterium H921]MDG0972513.1 disulfide bond formation protein B [Porticoccaceae bacterium]MDG1307845.1 disulfide bond formation protein B [Porticoccaceae bacterium]